MPCSTVPSTNPAPPCGGVLKGNDERAPPPSGVSRHDLVRTTHFRDRATSRYSRRDEEAPRPPLGLGPALPALPARLGRAGLAAPLPHARRGGGRGQRRGGRAFGARGGRRRAW